MQTSLKRERTVYWLWSRQIFEPTGPCGSVIVVMHRARVVGGAGIAAVRALRASRPPVARPPPRPRSDGAGWSRDVRVSIAAWAAAAGGAVAFADGQEPPTTGVTGGRGWFELVREVEDGDLRAVQTLVAVANDADNHAALVQAGAVHALVTAYQRGGGEAEAAANLGVLRALADLARSGETHSAFQDENVPDLLAGVFADHDVVEVGGLTSYVRWAGGLVGLGSSRNGVFGDMPAAGKVDEKAKKSRESALDESLALNSAQATATSSLGDVHGPSLIVPSDISASATAVDLRGGVIYHATRCAANLARDTMTHGALLSAGLLLPMVAVISAVPMRQLSPSASLADVVGDEQRADTVRFAALAVAALAKSDASAVVAAKGHLPLIALLGQSVDSVAQTYAAGGIRNLARHVPSDLDGTWNVHRSMVADGLAPSLAVSLAASSNPQTQVFSALAFGDILTTRHAKADVIAKRMRSSFDAFAALLSSGNNSVARACHRAVDTILSSDIDLMGIALLPVGVQKYGPLCDALEKHVGPLVRGAASKGDPIAMGAIAALALHEKTADAIVMKGVVAPLVSALVSNGDYGERAMVALARLSGFGQHMAEIVLRGGLRATMARSGANATTGRRWEANALANMARAEQNRPDIGHGGLPILMRAVQSSDGDAQREGARGLFNLTIGGVSRVLSAQGGAIGPLTKIADGPDEFARQYAVGAIAAISELHGFGHSIVTENGIAVLLRAVRADKSLARDVARCFAQLSNHIESHEALAKAGAAEWLVKAVSRGDAAADTLHHAAAALCNIAYTPGAPHDAMRKAGAAAALTGLSSGIYPPFVSQCARIALANLREEAPPVLQHADSHGQVDPL